jgi:hypothetical protein
VNLVVPVKDTVWWNTTGGMVIEYRDGATKDCTLLLTNDSHTIRFAWQADGVSLTANDPAWQVPEGKQPAAVQIGDVWLSKADSVALQVDGHNSTISYTIEQPIDELLRNADQITVKVAVGDLVLPLNHSKMAALLSAVQRCRKAIGLS